MRLSSPKRRGARSLDLSSFREALADRRLPTAIGVVFRNASAGSHYEVFPDDVMVHVRLQPNQEPILCRLAAVGGTVPGAGIWAIPAEGTEVGVVIPEGEIEGEPFVICVLGTGSVPHGLASSKIVIQAPPGGTVEIHDGSGDVDALVLKSDFDSHTHGGVSTGTGVTSIPSADPFGATPHPAAGTSVLKAK